MNHHAMYIKSFHQTELPLVRQEKNLRQYQYSEPVKGFDINKFLDFPLFHSQ